MRQTLLHTLQAAMMLLLLHVFYIADCRGKDNTGASAAVPNIIFDTDLGNCTDDAAAMQTLFYYRSLGQCNVIGVIGSFKNNQAKRLLDGFMHYYKADDIPLGFVDGDEPTSFPITPYCQLIDSLKADGTPLFPPTGVSISDRPNGWKLYRKLLSQAKDSSITMVCVGHFTNLGLLLDSKPDECSPLTGMELVQKKVKRLNLTGGCFKPMLKRYVTPNDTSKFIVAEYNISGDVPLARKVIEGWPTEVVILPLEAGVPFPSKHDAILDATKGVPDSPMYQITSHYDEWAAGDVGQYMWDVLSVINAIKGNELFDIGQECTIAIDDVGRTTITHSVKSDNTYVISVSTSKEEAVWTIFWKALRYSPSAAADRQH